MDKREFVKSIKEYLELEDFKAIGVGAGAVSLIRDVEEIIISYLKYPGVYRFRESIGCRKCFNEVEDILEKYFALHSLNYGRNTIYISSRRYEELSRIDIAKPEDIKKVLPQLKTMVYEDILPFFDRYDTLTSVYEQLVEYENDFSRINKFLFAPQPIRRIIINKLCEDPNWEEYAKSVYDSFKEASKSGQNQQMYESYAKVVEGIIEELGSF